MNSAEAAAYATVVFSAVVVVLLEELVPLKRQWRPARTDIANDLLYLAIVQIALPELLVLLAVLSVGSVVGAHLTPVFRLWPHYWPIWQQALLLLLSVDFLRYWLHRWAHENPLLWRVHAVHHSPHKLYWLNVGRVHFVEKALQFSVDSLPFIVLGVKKEVITLYFVFYCANGFLLHSNIRMRFGLLNYIMNTAELHRWHHSTVPEERDSNYGNNLIIWDLLFRTRYLPRKCTSVRELGLSNRHYPLGFWRQLASPFQGNVLFSNKSPTGSKASVL